MSLISAEITYFLSFIYIVFANVQNSFIFDYFIHENVSAVVGFSCNTKEGNDLLFLFSIFLVFYKLLHFFQMIFC